MEASAKFASSDFTPNQFKEFVKTTIRDPIMVRYVDDWYERRLEKEEEKGKKERKESRSKSPAGQQAFLGGTNDYSPRR